MVNWYGRVIFSVERRVGNIEHSGLGDPECSFFAYIALTLTQ